jgi:uncharacterized protein
VHITLHVTDRCNLRCRYCYAPAGEADMTFEVARRAVERLAAPENCGIVFFGGEPLLRRELIAGVLEWCGRKGPHRFHYKVTTNGTLLDADFLDLAERTGLQIALSHDGAREAHDANRIGPGGRGTFAALEPKLEMLLERRPYSPVMMVVDPAVVEHLAAGVEYLERKGARYIICSLNHAGAWDDRSLRALRKQYLGLEDWYLAAFSAGRKIYFSPFDKRIASRVADRDTSSCRVGYRQISVAPDGTLYPCVQFAGRRRHPIGSVAGGVDRRLREEIHGLTEREHPECRGCALLGRCRNKCGCLNMQVTGDPGSVPPILCEHERMLFPIADRIAGKLYARRDPLFIQRHYNPLFPLMSYLEDIAGS